MGDGAREEENDDDGGGDPEGAVEIGGGGVGVEGVEEGLGGEGGEGEEGVSAAVQDGGCVDVEVGPVEGEGPEHVFLTGFVGIYVRGCR